MRLHPLSLFLFALITKISFAQTSSSTEIFGKVTDGLTKEPMGYVNVHLYGGVPKTTMTDPKGEYRVRSIEKVDSIVFTYLGYTKRKVVLKRGGTQQLNIEMGTGELNLTEVTVKAGKKKKRVIDTAANYVFYQVLKYKEQNREGGAFSYYCESYDKLQLSLLNPSKKLTNFALFKPFHFVFENTDTTSEGSTYIPGVIKESVSDVYYRVRPRKQTRTFVKAEHMSGVNNPSVLSIADYEFRETDAYSNLYYFARTYFPAPFSPVGINTYYYYLTDTQRLDGRVSYKLHFVGKTKEDLALKGHAWIDSATWAIRSIVFRPNEKANLNFVNEYNETIDFTLVDGKYWMKSREDIESVGSLLKRKMKTGLLVYKSTQRRNFQTNMLFPDTIFRGAEDLILLDSARYKSKDYWDTARFTLLNRGQQRVFEISDTIRRVPSWKAYEFFGRFFTAAFADAGPISFGRVLNFGSRNNVEGWRVRFGFETNPRFQKIGTPANNFLRKFYFTGYIAYGLKDKDFKHLALTRIALPRKNLRWQTLEFSYRYDMRVPGQDEAQTLLTFDNIVTLISGKTLSKIMKVREFGVLYEKDWIRGLSSVISLTDKIYYDIPGVFNFSKSRDGIISAVPNFNVTEFMVDMRYSKREVFFIANAYRYFQITKYPVFMFRYTAGVVSLQGEHFNYHNLLFTYNQQLQTVAGFTNLSFKLGKILGKVPYTNAYLTQGNLGILRDRYNYNLLREFEFVTDQYAQFWLEHHFNGFFFNKIPGINKLRLREVIVFKSLIGNLSKKNAEVLVVPNELTSPALIPYIELGFGIENIINMFRVDFLWRATYRNNGGQNFGVKITFKPSF